MTSAKIVLVVGARPNFMKTAPVIEAIARHNVQNAEAMGIRASPILVHTGQHYDAAMSDAFFADLKLPQPDVFLGVGSGSHAVQTAEIMKKFEEVLLREWPDIVIVVGDVNSTVACALVTSKMGSNGGRPQPLVAHVEAGLRSFDRQMPEEVNRVVTDHLSDLLFVTEESGLENLKKEGIPQDKVFFVGNTMIDSLLASKDQADQSSVLDRFGLRTPSEGNGSKKGAGRYALLTLHRPANVDQRENFFEILEGLQELAASYPIVFPAHPRTRKHIQQFGLDSYFDFTTQTSEGASKRIRGVEPQGYIDFLCLMKNAHLVVTDSGGIQEETTCLGVPCVTVRANTERPVTLKHGTNVLAGVAREGIQHAIQQQLGRTHKQTIPPLWDGAAAGRIVEVLIRQLQVAETREQTLPRGA